MTGPEIIQTIDDPRVAVYGNVKDGELLKKHGLFMAESRDVVRRLLASRFAVRSVLVTEPAYRALEAELGEVPVYIGRRVVIDEIIGFHIHRGCLACGERGEPRDVADLMSSDPSEPSLVVGLDAVTNPDNIGGLFRNAAAFGAAAVLLSPTCADPLYRKSIRTSMGASLRVPFATEGRWPDGLEALKARGYTLVAVTPDGEVDIGEITPADKTVLLLGNEGAGLTDAVKAIADVRVRIPIAFEVDSINVSAAGAVALHRFCRAS